MRKVVGYTLVSVDGVAEAPELFVLDFDAEMEANLGEVIGAQDTVLLGRRMYDEWSDHWPRSDDEPFADFINTVQKYVASSTPLARRWTNAERIEGPVEDFVRELRAGDGGGQGGAEREKRQEEQGGGHGWESPSMVPAGSMAQKRNPDNALVASIQAHATPKIRITRLRG